MFGLLDDLLAYPPNTLLIIDRLVREDFLIEISAVAAV
jgi:hypothetical protein